MVELIQALSGSPNFGVFNFNRTYLERYRTARAKTLTGDSRTKIIFPGDSTWAGMGSTYPGYADPRGNSAPRRASQIVTARGGYVGNSDNWFGNNNLAVGDYNEYNPSVELGENWTLSATITGGGYMFVLTSPNTDVLTFTPANAFDTVDIYYGMNPGLGVISANIDGGVAVTQATSNGTAAVGKLTLDTTLGEHVVNITRDSGGSIFIIGMDAYNSEEPDFAFLNMGYSGSTTTMWNVSTNPWNPKAFLPSSTLGADLAIFNLGINNWRTVNAVPDSTTYSDMQALIQAQLVRSDVIIVAPIPSSTDEASVATQEAHIDRLYQLARENNCVLLDMTKLLVSYTQANAAGLYFDDLHLNKYGYWDYGEAVARLLLDI